MYKKITLITTLAALSACSGAPSDTEIREALARELTLQKPDFIQADVPAIVAKFKVISCNKAEPSGYNCDVENGEGRVINTRMVKTDKGWTALQK